MKKKHPDIDMQAEFDFSGGARGNYAEQFKKGSNSVILEPDVSEYFPEHESVNQALRSLIQIIKKHKA